MSDTRRYDPINDAVIQPPQRSETRLVPAVDDFPSVSIFTSDELREMKTSEIVSHTVRLQQLYERMESDYRIQKWELDEARNNLASLSQAVKLTHKLSPTDLESVAAVAVGELPQYFGCRFAAMFFYEAETKRLELFRSTEPVPEHRQDGAVDDTGHFLHHLFVWRHDPFIVEIPPTGYPCVAFSDGEVDIELTDEWRRLLGEEALVYPLQVMRGDKASVLGGLIIGDSSRCFEVRDIETSVLFSDLLSSSLYNARLVQQLNEMTIIDPLTQVFNRRHLLNQLNVAMLNASRYGHGLSIAMLDIDHFKRFNDTYGHICGDKVLREMGSLLKKAIRQGVDIPARYGGEEFVIIMPFINLEQGMIVARRIHEKVKETKFQFGTRNLNVTCSVGVAEYKAGENVEKFIDRADGALYQAKRDGRDRVIAAENDES